MNMIFSNSRANVKSNKQSTQFMNIPVRPQPPSNTQPSTITQPSEPPKKKMIWGQPTWFFLHTMAQKLKPEYFSVVRQGFLEQINTICRNLPCPDCSNHAAEYLDKINFNTLTTKESIITMLYDFHNAVNARKNIPLFPKSELYEKYSSANTTNIIQYFLIHFADKSKSIRMISNDFYRKRLIAILQQWLLDNLQYFEN